MKALILAAGRGNRLNEKTNSINKCMLKLNEKPILEHNIQRASEINEINEIIIVVGYQKEDIIEYFGFDYNGKSIKYIYQWEQLGLVHAIEIAKEILNGEDFFLLLGDEVLINPNHKEMIYDFLNNDYIFGFCGVVKQEDLSKISKTYGIFTSDDSYEGECINRLIEKPKTPPNNCLQGTGHCVFRNSILDYINETPVNIRRGSHEKELPDLIQCSVDDGRIVKPFVICSEYTNINTEEDLVEAKEMIKNKGGE